jgi:arsenate reductase
MKTRILILCTGNSCRSQMAEGILKNIDSNLQVFSAGIHPASHVSSNAIAVMKEIGLHIEQAYPKHVDQFLDQSFDFVITVCDYAREVCPVFTGKVSHQLHYGFEDPTREIGSDKEVLPVYRRVRDEIRKTMEEFYHTHIL